MGVSIISHGFLLLLLSWVKDNLVFLFLKIIKKKLLTRVVVKMTIGRAGH